MGDKSAIEWTDATWNPLRSATHPMVQWGCLKVSPGCDHCYASALHVRHGGREYPPGLGTPADAAYGLAIHEPTLTQPLRWTKPRRIFVCSMTDLFGEWVRDEWIDRIFAVMAQCPQHTFQVLTKRAHRMFDYMTTPLRDFKIGEHVCGQQMLRGCPMYRCSEDCEMDGIDWPLPNVWLGVSVESPAYLWRLNYLRRTPAAVRFVSAEPLLADLGAVNLNGIHWLITGGESGAGARHSLALCPHCCGGWVESLDADGRRVRPQPCPTCGATGWHGPLVDWVRSIRDQCQAAGVAFLHKQWGGRTPKAGGRVLDGRTWDEYPVVAA